MNVLESFSLKGKVALVTGGSGKYGSCITTALAEAGATTYLASIDDCQKLADTLCSKGYDVKAGNLDLADEKSINDLYKRIIDEQGKVDILVNCAVIRPMKGYNDDIANFRLSMEINATALFYITRLFAQNMIERKTGSIINISSIYGLLGPDYTLYEGTEMSGDTPPEYFFNKGGMNQLTKYLGSVLGKYNIRVNSICPGGYEKSALNEEFRTRYSRKTFLNRLANDDDIKGLVVFLASDASSYITGAIIPLDGGYIAK